MFLLSLSTTYFHVGVHRKMAKIGPLYHTVLRFGFSRMTLIDDKNVREIVDNVRENS